jgi:hypothetical protein
MPLYAISRFCYDGHDDDDENLMEKVSFSFFEVMEKVFSSF